MNTITIEISDERWLKVQETANRLGVSVEELLLMGVEQVLNQSQVSFKDAMDYVLRKNSELYQRLA
jgi:antitoxin FitA